MENKFSKGDIVVLVNYDTSDGYRDSDGNFPPAGTVGEVMVESIHHPKDDVKVKFEDYQCNGKDKSSDRSYWGVAQDMLKLQEDVEAEEGKWPEPELKVIPKGSNVVLVNPKYNDDGRTYRDGKGNLPPYGEQGTTISNSNNIGETLVVFPNCKHSDGTYHWIMHVDMLRVIPKNLTDS